MCIPAVTAPTKADGECVRRCFPRSSTKPQAHATLVLGARNRAFVRAELLDVSLTSETSGWLWMHLRASAPHADVVLPLCLVLFVNATVLLLPWWTAMFLMPGLGFLFGALSFAAARVPAPGRTQRTRVSVVVVVALLIAGAVVFVTTLAPAMVAQHPRLVALEASMFVLNALAFWKTVFNDPGFVPMGRVGAPAPAAPPGARVCPTCLCVRPLRSKHDPFIGRCVRCAAALPRPHTACAVLGCAHDCSCVT